MLSSCVGGVSISVCNKRSNNQVKEDEVGRACSTLAGGEWSASHPCCFLPRERTLGTHGVDLIAVMDDMEKLVAVLIIIMYVLPAKLLNA
jgi:hypothetical protein